MNSQRPSLAHLVEQLPEEALHRRPVALDRARRQRRVDEVAQPPVIVAVDADDVVDDLLVQRPVADLEDLRDRQPGEDRLLGAKEELARLALGHDVAERARRQPSVVSVELGHRVAIHVAAQRGVGVVKRRELELGGQHQRGASLERHGQELVIRRGTGTPMSRPVAVICVLLVGILAALQPAANASFSKIVGDLGAAFSSL